VTWQERQSGCGVYTCDGECWECRGDPGEWAEAVERWREWEDEAVLQEANLIRYDIAHGNVAIHRLMRDESGTLWATGTYAPQRLRAGARHSVVLRGEGDHRQIEDYVGDRDEADEVLDSLIRAENPAPAPAEAPPYPAAEVQPQPAARVSLAYHPEHPATHRAITAAAARSRSALPPPPTSPQPPPGLPPRPQELTGDIPRRPRSI